jgi:hypothetical protein
MEIMHTSIVLQQQRAVNLRNIQLTIRLVPPRQG